ncbi:MAG TPA: hypothetical protein VFA86_00680 [Gammaproteobacteria bacterium]|nr:hypothetical protein [Gammaproteobacteria bacterium]
MSVAYFVIGFLLGNGMPHFVFGAAGRTFRSPFGRHSPPRANLLWGLANFVAMSLLLAWQARLARPTAGDLLWLGIGYWVAVALFGLFIRWFLPADSDARTGAERE